MSKILHLSNILEFKAIRVTCHGCGTVMMINNMINQLPSQCTCCRAVFDTWLQDDIRTLEKVFSHMQLFSKENKLNVSVEFESVPVSISEPS